MLFDMKLFLSPSHGQDGGGGMEGATESTWPHPRTVSVTLAGCPVVESIPFLTGMLCSRATLQIAIWHKETAGILAGRAAGSGHVQVPL